MIRSVEFRKIEIPMVKSFRIALGSTESYEGFIVRITTDDGLTGIGEAVPTPFITGETTASIQEALKLLSGSLKGMEETDTEKIYEVMNRTIHGSYAAKCGLDTALWDIAGKRAGLPLCKLLGGYRDSIPTSFTVDIGDPDEVVKYTKEFIEAGLTAIKVKLGQGLREDYERVKRARQTAGDGATIYVDFNQSYSAKRAVELSSDIHKFNIEFLEQPTPAHDIAGLKFVREHSDIPVMADEAVYGPEDAMKIVRCEAADMINMKLMKAGGITRGRKVIEIAEAAGLPVMIGCMVETRVAVTAGTHLALGMRNVKYADLDGYSSLARDITSGGLVLKEGRNYVSDGAGLGIDVTEQ
ncbi:MAG: dipeptide epimerase [Thermoplasmata archaeon]|uniref:Dipeptide epimerase n=1 Tax=Candidatus Sysuiplasma superficiale TaxID=2823368 RepID=A0A8J7YUF2_9ARCH|nr:dipeptide epimerase [Candidatus Sysuiplasma superficiale]MBX8644707.1 dipeptide epimerase [Candidatus Sysuiplasma superficiale]